MIAFDTNVLVHAYRKESPFHDSAWQTVKDAAQGSSAWALPWPCVHEFLAIVTNPKIFKPPTPLDLAIRQIGSLLGSPKIVLLGEQPGYWDVLSKLLRAGRIQGGKVHDARIAALAIFHDVEELLTADRDFSRFPELACRNPLKGA